MHTTKTWQKCSQLHIYEPHCSKTSCLEEERIIDKGQKEKPQPHHQEQLKKATIILWFHQCVGFMTTNGTSKIVHLANDKKNGTYSTSPQNTESYKINYL